MAAYLINDNMITVIASHEVSDFNNWKAGFDTNEAARNAAGARLSGLYTSVSDPNQVTLILEFEDLEGFHAFTGDPEFQSQLQKAGVVGKPEFKLLNKVS